MWRFSLYLFLTPSGSLLQIRYVLALDRDGTPLVPDARDSGKSTESDLLSVGGMKRKLEIEVESGLLTLTSDQVSRCFDAFCSIECHEI